LRGGSWVEVIGKECRGAKDHCRNRRFPSRYRYLSRPQGAEKVVANAIFMENPSDEQFKKLKDDFRKI
jgi:hypothetical protein